MSQQRRAPSDNRRRNIPQDDPDWCAVCCTPCDHCVRTCDSSILFAGFIACYIVSFLLDVFVIRGGYLALSIAQRGSCVKRSGFAHISPDLVLCLLFVACFHSIALVWIIGYIHSKQITERWSGVQIVHVPDEWPRICGFPCDWTLCIPLACYYALLVTEFGLTVYVYLFLADLVEIEPQAYIEHFCVGFEEVQEAFEWMEFSLFFFVGTIFMSCIYGCLLRIGTISASNNANARNINSDHQPLNSDMDD